MVTVDLARRLRSAGLRWVPARGDRFVLPDRGMDDEVFVLSDMTVEVHDFPGGSVIGFNGVTEWALDSVEQGQALWLPAENQLRRLLGGLFTRLTATADGFEVTVRMPDGERCFTAADPSQAYGEALHAVLVGVHARTS